MAMRQPIAQVLAEIEAMPSSGRKNQRIQAIRRRIQRRMDYAQQSLEDAQGYQRRIEAIVAEELAA